MSARPINYGGTTRPKGDTGHIAKMGYTLTQIEKIIESLQFHPTDSEGNPSFIPSWVVDEIAHSQAAYPREWSTRTGSSNPDYQFKFVTQKDVSNPNTFTPNYSSRTYNVVRPAGGTLGTPYEGVIIGKSTLQKNFILKVTTQFVRNMSDAGWTFTPQDTKPSDKFVRNMTNTGWTYVPPNSFNTKMDIGHVLNITQKSLLGNRYVENPNSQNPQVTQSPNLTPSETTPIEKDHSKLETGLLLGGIALFSQKRKETMRSDVRW